MLNGNKVSTYVMSAVAAAAFGAAIYQLGYQNGREEAPSIAGLAVKSVKDDASLHETIAFWQESLRSHIYDDYPAGTTNYTPELREARGAMADLLENIKQRYDVNVTGFLSETGLKRPSAIHDLQCIISSGTFKYHEELVGAATSNRELQPCHLDIGKKRYSLDNDKKLQAEIAPVNPSISPLIGR